MTRRSDAVLIDTSVWIASFRGAPENVTEITRELLKEDRALICGPVLFEIRRGLRLPEREKVIPLMEAIVRLPVEEEDWDLAGELDATLRSKGITIPPMDLIIARLCIRYNVQLFTLDRHFESIEGIRLFKVF